jgi:hypothetical protein
MAFKPCSHCKTPTLCKKAGKCLNKEKSESKSGLAGRVAAATTNGKGY